MTTLRLACTGWNESGVLSALQRLARASTGASQPLHEECTRLLKDELVAPDASLAHRRTVAMQRLRLGDALEQVALR